MVKSRVLFSSSINLVVYVLNKDDKILFEAENGIVYGAIPPGIEYYSIDDIKRLVEQSFERSCKVVKSDMYNLLDRVSLFMSGYDDDKVTLTFGEDGLTVSSKYATETIAYTDSENADEFICQTDINTLLTIVKAQTGGEFTIEFGEENALKLIDGDITSVVALLTEE